VCITGDHSTPVKYGDHSHEPVPICIGNVMGQSRRQAKFDELTCARGRLGRFGGSEIIGVLKKINI
jgi:2,3-bisphosphoglycerate-independent phosphoglycerate mutase